MDTYPGQHTKMETGRRDFGSTVERTFAFESGDPLPSRRQRPDLPRTETEKESPAIDGPADDDWYIEGALGHPPREVSRYGLRPPVVVSRARHPRDDRSV